jgi:hypothetical protein
MSVKSCAWWAALAGHGVPDRGLAAAPAAVGGDPLDVVIVQVADVNPAVYAGVGAFEAGVVRLYDVVVILGRWLRVGCARLIHGGLLSRLSGLRGSFDFPAGAFLYVILSSHIFKLLASFFLVCFNNRKHRRREDGADTETQRVA